MSENGLVPDVLLFVGLSALGLVLLFAWGLWFARGGRETTISFKGLGMSVTILTTTARQQQILDSKEDND